MRRGGVGVQRDPEEGARSGPGPAQQAACGDKEVAAISRGDPDLPEVHAAPGLLSPGCPGLYRHPQGFSAQGPKLPPTEPWHWFSTVGSARSGLTALPPPIPEGLKCLIVLLCPVSSAISSESRSSSPNRAPGGRDWGAGVLNRMGPRKLKQSRLSEGQGWSVLRGHQGSSGVHQGSTQWTANACIRAWGAGPGSPGFPSVGLG